MLHIETEVPLGGLLCGIHVWAAQAMFVLALADLASILITGSYKRPREANWLIGLGLLGMVGLLLFTGSTPRWDQDDFEAVEHNSGLADLAGGFGTWFTSEFAPATPLVSRLYLAHVRSLPALVFVLLIIHLALVKRHGGSAKSSVDVGEPDPTGRLGLDHFFPGGRVAGYIAFALAVALPSVFAFEVIRSGIQRRRASDAVLLTTSRFERNDAPIFVLPGDKAHAVAIPGRHPVVVLSTSMCRDLSEDELALVVRHELTHIRSHSYFLIVIGAMEPLARLIPFIRRSLDTLGLTLELWADEAAAQTATDRSMMRALLGKVALDRMNAGPEVGAIGPVTSRLSSLANPIPVRAPGAVLGLLTLSALIATGAMSVVMWLTGSPPWL